jgi:hypothetical protein
LVRNAQLTVPGHRHSVSAHQALACLAIEAVDQQLHVFLQLASAFKILPVPFDRHVIEAQQRVEAHVKRLT